MIEIELWNMYEDFHAVIIPFETGVLWTNQAGGVSCQHPKLEGLLIPLGHCPDETLEGLPVGSEYDDKEIQRFLNRSGTDHIFRPLSKEEQGNTEYEFGEAWVPVIIKTECTYVELKNFTGKTCIVTYNNSD